MLREHGLSRHSHVVGKTERRARVRRGLARRQGGVQRAAARPAPGVGRGELAHRAAARQPGLRRRRARGGRRAPTTRACTSHLASTPARATSRAPCLNLARPKVAILREQGVNSHVEMSYAMRQAGFDTFDVHMTDLQAGRARLDRVPGLRRLRRLQLRRHARRRRRLGAQRSSSTRSWPSSSRPSSAAPTPSRSACATAARCWPRCADIIPGAQAWPRFTRNKSEQFEARLSHGRGAATRPACSSPAWPAAACRSRWRTARAMPTSRSAATRRRCSARCASSTTTARPTEAYPFNPNGSPGGLTAVTTADGRFTALMPHPERVFRNVQMSWTTGERSAAQPVDADLRATRGASSGGRARSGQPGRGGRRRRGVDRGGRRQPFAHASAGVIGPMWPTPGSVTLAQRGSTEASRALIGAHRRRRGLAAEQQHRHLDVRRQARAAAGRRRRPGTRRRPWASAARAAPPAGVHRRPGAGAGPVVDEKPAAAAPGPARARSWAPRPMARISRPASPARLAGPASRSRAKRVGSYSVSRATRLGQRSAICIATAPP